MAEIPMGFDHPTASLRTGHSDSSAGSASCMTRPQRAVDLITLSFVGTTESTANPRSR
jgi:hypothetical protein